MGTILLVALIVFSFAISRVLPRFASRYFMVSGVEYLVVGLVLGPVTGVIDFEMLQRFKLLIALMLGLLGFILGLQARELVRSIRIAIAGLFASSIVWWESPR